MSLIAPYVDGKLQTSTTSSESLKNSSNKSAVDSDTFLTLLVAEMQNQDPLEPTSNTEWVSQYATFTQVEQMGEMSDSMDMLRANNLVGKEVIMKVTSVSTGETSYVRGPVDYITIEEGKPLLNIGGSSYSLDDLDTVTTKDYQEMAVLVTEFSQMIADLPDAEKVTLVNEEAIKEARTLYDSMTKDQKGYVDPADVKKLEAAEERIKEIKGSTDYT